MGLIEAIKNRLWYGGGRHYEDEEQEEQEEGGERAMDEQPRRAERRRPRLLKLPSVREKHIFVMRPTGLQEVMTAADYLKAGSAIFLNLQSIDRIQGQRIVDMMSGLCYGIDGSGHKVGDRLFIFTPRDYQIASEDEDINETGLFISGFDISRLETLSNQTRQAEISSEGGGRGW